MNKYTLRELINDVEELRSAEISSEDGLRLWQDRASTVLIKISKGPCDFNEIPEIIFHYLSDADIRLKDERYRSAQEKAIKEAVIELMSKLP